MHRLTAGNPLFLATAIDHLVRKGYIVDSRDGWRAQVPARRRSREPFPRAWSARSRGSSRNWRPMSVRPSMPRASSAPSSRLWLAAHAADMDELALEPVLEMLARRRTFIVREGVVELANGVFSPVYRFTHGLYQEIVLEHTDPKTRADAHGRAGRAMERVFAGREHEAAADLACHFHGAGDHLRAAQYLRVAAGNALKRYAPREAAALLHGAVTHAAHLPPDERTRVEMSLMLELGQAQLATGETDLAHPHPAQARAPRRRRASSRRSPARAADPRRSASRHRSRGGARLRSPDQGRRAARERSQRWPRPRRSGRASSSSISRDGRTRSRTVASRRGGSFRVRPRTNIARSPSGCCSSTRRGRRTRTRGAPDAGCCRKPWRAATSPTAPTATTCSASPRCTSAAGTRRRPSPPKAPRSASARAALATPSRCGCCRRGSRSRRSASTMRIE